MSSAYIQVFTTTDNKESAKRIAGALVQNRLVACAQISGPITSIFRWKDRMEEQEEWMIIMKTREDLYPQVEKSIRDNHAYEVPEILGLPVVAGNRDYLDWLDRETGLNREGMENA